MNKELFDYFSIEREESSSGGREAEAEGNMWAALIKQAVDCARKNTKLGIQAREWLFSGGKIIFDEPQRGVAAGQSAVFYLGEEMLGGGIIQA